jgi:hypothetical protein
MSNYISTLDFRIPVDFYVNPSFCEDLSLLDDDNIVPFFGGLCIALDGMSQEAANARFRSMKINFVESQNTQNSDYDRMAPFIFLYIYSAYPRNHTDAFLSYQANKSKGFMRIADKLVAVYALENLHISREALVELKGFMETHNEFCSFACKIFLSFLSTETGNIVHTYAVELKQSVSYSNMVGVKMIKEEIIDKAHPIVGQSEVSRSLMYYRSFVRQAASRYGSNWTFIALLERDTWLEFSRSAHFTRLWIIAGILGMPDNTGYANMMVKGTRIGDHSTVPYYSKLVRRYVRVAEDIVVESTEHSRSTNDRINLYLQNWNRSDHRTDMSSYSDGSGFPGHI